MSIPQIIINLLLDINLEGETMYIQDWTRDKLKEIAGRLPTFVHSDPSSFACGFNAGYKLALLDLDNLIEDGASIYRSNCTCGDKYHERGEICL